MNHRLLNAALSDFQQADRMLANGLSTPAAKLHERALFVALCSATTIRSRTVETLKIGDIFQRDSHGRQQIVVQGCHIKNGERIVVTLLEPIATRVVRHVTTFRPILIGSGRATALFSKRMVRDGIAVAMSLHTIRHLPGPVLIWTNPDKE
jgi:hypothetical protein